MRAVYNDKSGYRDGSGAASSVVSWVRFQLCCFIFPCVVTLRFVKMESLPPKTQEQIKKMSTEYLVLKLSKAGLDEEVILKMSREQLMATWADLVATGKDKPAAVAAAAAITKAHYDPELEKQRLQFEMRNMRKKKRKQSA